MPRRILHYSPGPADFVALLDERAVSGAWFDLHRQGGCGAGELRLKDEFPDRHAVRPGDWIAFEYSESDRWYLGRVEHRQSASPAGVALRLEGMGVELGEVFPGGFGLSADGQAPHRYARTDLFPNDPDYLDETLDSVNHPHEAAALLVEQYVAPRTHVALDPLLIEPGPDDDALASLKFRGEESVRSAIKELALRARNAAWGVDEAGAFFFLQPRATLLATWREGRDLLSLAESCERDNLFNRVLLTGDYVYDAPVNSEVTARGFYRWRGNYVQPASRDQHGERRIRLWIPWIRTRSDSRAFVREFFRVYSQPTTRYLIEVAPQASLPRPWLGTIRLEDRFGHELITASIETIRVQFDHAPKFRVELGPPDPRTLWPEPPHDERWEIAASPNHGGDILTFPSSSSTDSSSDASSDPSSDASSDASSDSSSDLSSDASSESSSESSSDVLSSSSVDSSSNSSSLSSFSSDSSSGSSDLSSLSSSLDSSDSSSEVSSDSSAESSSQESTSQQPTSEADTSDDTDASDSAGNGSDSEGGPGDSSEPTSGITSDDSSSSHSSNSSHSSCLCDDDWSTYGALLLWLEADKLASLSHGDPVSSWSDESGSGNDASQPDADHQPHYIASAVHGLPAVRAVNRGSGMEILNERMVLSNLDRDEFTLVAVMQDRDSSGLNLLAGACGSIGFGGNGGQFLSKTCVGEVSGGSTPADRFYINVVTWDGTTARFYLDGASAGSAAPAWAFDSDNADYGLFERLIDEGTAQCDLACLLMFNAPLDNTPRQALEACLACKYAIDISG